jgi:hypothetical protein
LFHEKTAEKTVSHCFLLNIAVFEWRFLPRPAPDFNPKLRSVLIAAGSTREYDGAKGANTAPGVQLTFLVPEPEMVSECYKQLLELGVQIMEAPTGARARARVCSLSQQARTSSFHAATTLLPSFAKTSSGQSGENDAHFSCVAFLATLCRPAAWAPDGVFCGP